MRKIAARRNTVVLALVFAIATSASLTAQPKDRSNRDPFKRVIDTIVRVFRTITFGDGMEPPKP